MKLRDLFLYAVAAFVGFFGLIIVLGALMNLSTGEEDLVTTISLGLGMGVLPLVFSGWLVRRTWTGSKRRRQEELERRVMDLAAQSDGHLAPAQLAQATDLTLEESKAFLDQLHLDGHCQTDLTEDGRVIYRFSA